VNANLKEINFELGRLHDLIIDLKEEKKVLLEKLNRIKTLVIECDADNRVPQPYEILDIINE
jgi:hypothetical protein